jgi:hypothetical protein
MGRIGDVVGAVKLIHETFPEINDLVFEAILEYLRRRLHLTEWEYSDLWLTWNVIAKSYKERTKEDDDLYDLYKQRLEKYLGTNEGKTLQIVLAEIKEKFFSNVPSQEGAPFEVRIRRLIQEGMKRG